MPCPPPQASPAASLALPPGLRRRPGLALLLAVAAVLLAVVAAAVVAAPARAQAPCADPAVRLDTAGPDAVEAAVGCLVNAERAARRLSPVRPAGALERAAGRHATDMVTRRYFAHVSPSGGTVDKRDRRAGYLTAPCWVVGEDLGWAPPELASAQDVVAAWMASPAHRAVILDPEFHEIGIGVAARAPTPDGLGATFVLEMGSMLRCGDHAEAGPRARVRVS